MGRRYGELRTYLFGWMNYFGIAMKYNDAVEFDHWLRRRVRMCYMKQGLTSIRTLWVGIHYPAKAR